MNNQTISPSIAQMMRDTIARMDKLIPRAETGYLCMERHQCCCGVMCAEIHGYLTSWKDTLERELANTGGA